LEAFYEVFVLLYLGSQQLVFEDVFFEDVLGEIIGASFCGRHTGIST
jgi:hypothetical protein